ncbi:MAG: hypothetical protein NDI61_11675, partial [Bdellovibrionaceae bacterium]|nr:hypothetical protein [Pseudobdellovibrionaceae bacterium]
MAIDEDAKRNRGQVENQLNQLDLALREGQVQSVRNRLRNWRPSEIPEAARARVADIARRAGLPMMILRLLRPKVRPQTVNAEIPSDQELALYGIGLSRIGAFQEAKKIFSTLEQSPDPQVHFFAGQVDMLQWDYKAAIPHFQKFVASASIEAYRRLVGHLNLAACLIAHARLDEAESSLVQIVATKHLGQPKLITGNVAELSAQIAIQRQDYRTARYFLQQAGTHLSSSRETYRIFIEKWQVLLELLESGPSSTMIEKVRSFQQRAVASGEFEAARDCDFYLAKATGDNRLWLRLYYGTRFEAYRQRLLREHNIEFGSSPDLSFSLGPEDDPSQIEIDARRRLLTPQFTAQLKKDSSRSVSSLRSSLRSPLQSPLRLSRLESTLLDVLLSDRYRPLQFGEILSDLYPNEFFHPTASPAKGFQIIHRMRQLFTAQNLPLEIEVRGGQVRLLARG